MAIVRFAAPLIAIMLATGRPGLAQQEPSTGYPPPGRLIDIGGRRLHLHCSGRGVPTVILVAGGGAFSIDWTLVQQKVAETTRVCSYDRAGLGWSDPGSAEETVEATINDLHLLVRAFYGGASGKPVTPSTSRRDRCQGRHADRAITVDS